MVEFGAAALTEAASFWLLCGPSAEPTQGIERTAMSRNEAPRGAHAADLLNP
jgi:hypothetical protein